MKTQNVFVKMATVVVFCFVVASCNKEDNEEMMALNPSLNNNVSNTALATGNIRWKRVEAQTFTVEIPEDWQYLQLPSMDTYNGLFSNNRDSMTYEYGIIPDTFKIDPERFTFHYEIIDGRQAKILQGERYGVAIDDVYRGQSMQRRFIMMQSSSRPMGDDVALRIIRSLKFK